jgi:hypothetical protein
MDTHKIDANRSDPGGGSGAATGSTTGSTTGTSKRLRAASAFAEGGPCLVLLSSQLGDRVVPLLSERVTIGGGKGCDVRLTHPDLDATEIEVRRDGSAWRARSMLDGARLLVNGEHVQERLLRPNDAIDLAGRGTMFFSDRRLA